MVDDLVTLLAHPVPEDLHHGLVHEFDHVFVIHNVDAVDHGIQDAGQQMGLVCVRGFLDCLSAC
jgi:hypothetical protein